MSSVLQNASRRTASAAGSLVGFHAVTFFLALLLVFGDPEYGMLLFAPLVLAQFGLMNFWMAFGSGRWEERMVVWGAVMFLVTIPLLWLPAVVALVHVGGFTLLRRKVAGLYFFVGDGDRHRRLQFSLKDLLVVMLLVALVFAAARLVRTLDERNDLGWTLAIAVLIAFASGLFLLHALTAWAVLATERPRLGLLGSCAVGGLLAAVLTFAVDMDAGAYAVNVSVGALHALIFGVSLGAIRGDGYRLIRHPSDAAAIATCDPLAPDDEIHFLDEPPRP
jgi:hypothetical protein